MKTIYVDGFWWHIDTVAEFIRKNCYGEDAQAVFKKEFKKTYFKRGFLYPKRLNNDSGIDNQEVERFLSFCKSIHLPYRLEEESLGEKKHDYKKISTETYNKCIVVDIPAKLGMDIVNSIDNKKKDLQQEKQKTIKTEYQRRRSVAEEKCSYYLKSDLVCKLYEILNSQNVTFPIKLEENRAGEIYFSTLGYSNCNKGDVDALALALAKTLGDNYEAIFHVKDPDNEYDYAQTIIDKKNEPLKKI